MAGSAKLRKPIQQQNHLNSSKWVRVKNVNYIKKEELAMKLLWQFEVIDLIKDF